MGPCEKPRQLDWNGSVHANKIFIGFQLLVDTLWPLIVGYLTSLLVNRLADFIIIVTSRSISTVLETFRRPDDKKKLKD